MPKELIEEKFNEMLWRMNSIEPVDSKLQIKLQIAFQEGILKGQQYVINQVKSAI